jgi:hypothetical protein
VSLIVSIFASGRAILDTAALVAVFFDFLDEFRADSALLLHG